MSDMYLIRNPYVFTDALSFRNDHIDFILVTNKIIEQTICKIILIYVTYAGLT